MERRLIHLRIKIKSLAAEAEIIRKEAKKVKGMDRWNLNDHRTSVVRKHTRDNLLAYGLLRGLSYSAMEKKCDQAPDWKHVLEIATRFKPISIDTKCITDWIEEAKIYIKQHK